LSEFASLADLSASLVVGGVLLYAGAAKLRRRERFLAALDRYTFLPSAVRAPLSFAIPLTEIALGTALVLAPGTPYAAIAGALLLGLFTVAVVLKTGVRGTSDCGCFGDQGAQTRTSVVGRNLSLIVLALVAWAGGSGLAAGAESAVVVAFGAASIALVASLLGPTSRETTAPPEEPVSQERRRFLRLAGSTLAGLVAAASLGVMERRNAEAACLGCGTCGTDYTFLYCVGSCCAMYWVRPYKDCGSSCPACSGRTQMYCGIPSCC
jgi:hypothetical protein